MSHSIQNIYESHHIASRENGFTLLEEDRGKLFQTWVGEGKRVLDLGCRDGALTKYFSSGNTVTGADIDENGLRTVKAELGIRTVFVDLNGDWNELGGEKFDVVTAGEVVEHLYFPEAVFSRIVGHLKKNGRFIGSVPNAFNLKNRFRFLFGTKRGTPLSDPTHINHFHAKELEGMLKKYFNNVEIKGLGRYKKLARMHPNFFAFDLAFCAQEPKQ